MIIHGLAQHFYLHIQMVNVMKPEMLIAGMLLSATAAFAQQKNETPVRPSADSTLNETALDSAKKENGEPSVTIPRRVETDYGNSGAGTTGTRGGTSASGSGTNATGSRKYGTSDDESPARDSTRAEE
jgi:hypothetical protein